MWLIRLTPRLSRKRADSVTAGHVRALLERRLPFATSWSAVNRRGPTATPSARLPVVTVAVETVATSNLHPVSEEKRAQVDAAGVRVSAACRASSTTGWTASAKRTGPGGLLAESLLRWQ